MGSVLEVWGQGAGQGDRGQGESAWVVVWVGFRVWGCVVGFGQVRSKRFDWVWLGWTDLGEEFPDGRGTKSESGWLRSEAGMVGSVLRISA